MLSSRKSIRPIIIAIDKGYLCNLKELDLQCMNDMGLIIILDCRITDRNVQLLLSVIYKGKCPILQSLNLSNNAMGRNGCKMLSLCLSSDCFDSIQRIDIQRITTVIHHLITR